MDLNHSSYTTINKIPITNIWLLILYASRLYKEIDKQQRIALEKNPEKIIDLVAKIYFKEVNKRFRSSLSKGYKPCKQKLSRIRGKIDTLVTARKLLLEKGKVQCLYNDLTSNIPKNQYIHAAAHVLLNQLTENELIYQCKKIINRFNEFKIEQSKNYNYKEDYFNRSNRQDILLISLANLIFSLSIPTELSGNYIFKKIDKTDAWLRNLFEKAIVGFCHVNFDSSKYSILSNKKFKWPCTQSTANIEKFMPDMITDLIIENTKKNYRLIVDTKCTSIFSKKSHSFKTSHLYQLYAYVRSQEQINDPLSLSASGMLLYPTINKSINEQVTIQEHKLIFCTIDLTQNANSIKKNLFSLFSNL